MSVEVVTVLVKRDDGRWQDYLPLLRIQRDSALHFGHKHLVVTDGNLGDEFEQLIVGLPAELMPAMIAGIVERLKLPVDSNLVLVDVDCLVMRDLEAVFTGEFDLGLTRRVDPVSPVNNGVMYIDQNANALPFFDRALSLCGTHWGADQEAISQAASPVPQTECVENRGGLRLGFLSMRTHNAVPKEYLAKHYAEPFVLHFKGDRKDWMAAYAAKFVLKEN